MIVAKTIAECREALAHKTGIGFVPTMGALHRGHEELIRMSREYSQVSVVSIFVNPLQFGPNEDLSRYPRPIEADLALCEEHGTDVVFYPSPDEFTKSVGCTVSSGPLGTIYEGASRPGHFDGVATIVTKLFLIIQPDAAFFGLKDLQQCAVITSLCSSLNFPIQLKFVEIIREHDGLALSSRNTYLTSEERDIAPHLHENLRKAAALIRSEGIGSAPEACASAAGSLDALGFQTDYVSLVDPDSFRFPKSLSRARIIAAVRLGSVRLIDNVPLD